MTVNAVAVWNEYAKAWRNVPDAERREILSQVLSAELSYAGPTGVSVGHEGVIRDIEGVQAKVPGASFVARSAYAHHEFALIEWQLILPDGSVGVMGFDSIRMSEEERSRVLSGLRRTRLRPRIRRSS